MLYSSYVNLIDSDDDSNEAVIAACEEEEYNVNLAIQASLQDANENDWDLKEILRDHQVHCVSTEEPNEIIVRRARLLQTAFVAVQSKTFNCCKELTVKFSGEDGSDAGGPRREFFRLAMHQLSSYSGLFEGQGGCMMFCHNIKLVEQNKFFLAGRLVGMSLSQGGPGICCFHPSVYHLMCDYPADLTNFDVDDIVDPDFGEVIKQVQYRNEMKFVVCSKFFSV